MEGPDLDRRDAVGSVNRIVMNVGFAVIGAIPTLVVALLTPWKLGPLVLDDEPLGRRGLLLAPGVYFLIALTVVMLFTAILIPGAEDVSAEPEPFVGPGFARAVLEAVEAGNLWKTLSVMAPIYVVALVLAVAIAGLRMIAGPWLTLERSMRLSLYLVTTLIGFAATAGAVIDALNRVVGDNPIVAALTAALGGAVLVTALYTSFFLFRQGPGVGVLRAAALSALTVLLFIVIAGLESILFA